MVARVLCCFLLLLGGCVLPQADNGQRLGDVTINQDTVWEGEILVDGKVRVVGGATLSIRPGTRISFVRRDADQDGLGDAAIELEHASLLALGTAGAPIVFRSAEPNPAPGDWLEIKADFARRLRLAHCIISDSAHGLHAHFSKGSLEDSILRDNIDGTRFGQGRFTVRHCLVVGNRGKGINFRNSDMEIVGNILRGNRVGLFIFETDRQMRVHGNNFVANGQHVRLGDFFRGRVSLGRNWFGSSDPAVVAPLLYDRGEDPDIGLIEAELAAGWLPATGPRQAPLRLEETGSLQGEGYFDASAVGEGGWIYLPGWDGLVYAFDAAGRLAWKSAVGEVVDATPALDADLLYLQTWGREVLALDRRDGSVRWRFSYAESPHDDHRQGGLVRIGSLLLVPAWNGTLYALDAANGELVWAHDCGAPLRAAPALARKRIFQPSGSGRLTILDLQGRQQGRIEFDAPLLSTPLVTPSGVVLATRAGDVVALDDRGRNLWRYATGERCFYGAPVARDGLLYLATAAGRLYCFDLERGDLLWRSDLAGPSYATPLVVGGRIFVGDNDGVLQVFNADSGERLALARFDGAVQSTPLAAGDRLIVGARDSRIHLLQLAGQ